MDDNKNAEKNSFVMYTSYKGSFELLSDTDKGKLMMAIFEYQITRCDPDLTGEVGMAFSFIKQTLDRDYKKWIDVKAKKIEAGRKGGIASGESRREQNETE